MAAVVLLTVAYFRHQRRLKRHAYLMREALHNRDLTFRIDPRHLTSGERAMQELLNDMGQEIHMLMARNEVESWRSLVRALTHEIMNSTAPITSLSQTFVQHPAIKGTDLEDGMRAIYTTSQWLNNFVKNYRKLTQLQAPHPSDVNLHTFATSIVSIYPDVTWKVSVPDVTIHTDEGLLRQVFVNIIKNAIEAGAKYVGIEASDERSIMISNNGPAITSDMRQELFTPFFTTKPGGSGIGLSLSRQIMVMQGGNLLLKDVPRSGFTTTFQLIISSSIPPNLS